jgi:hypothetical protein
MMMRWSGPSSDGLEINRPHATGYVSFPRTDDYHYLRILRLRTFARGWTGSYNPVEERARKEACLKKIILMIAIILAGYASAWAGECQLDLDAATAAICDRQLASGIRTCREMHPDPLDYDDLAMCIGYSQDVYSKCTSGCR